MGKKNFNGRIETSSYKETGNIVNDVLENDFRLLHESTPNGFTHERVDRDDYVTEDYYFPNPEDENKHLHYEFRYYKYPPTVELYYKPKTKAHKVYPIAGGAAMVYPGRKLSRNRSLDETNLRKESEIQVQEGKKIIDLGAKFEFDKARLEDQIEIVQNSILSDADKERIITELNASIESVQKQYDSEVAAAEEQVQHKLTEQIESMQEAADELETQAENLRDIEMEASFTDASGAADAAEVKKQEYEQMKAEYVEKLKAQMEQAEIQQRNIRNRRLTGRE